MKRSIEMISKISDNIGGHYKSGAEAQNISSKALEDGFDNSDISVSFDKPLRHSDISDKETRNLQNNELRGSLDGAFIGILLSLLLGALMLTLRGVGQWNEFPTMPIVIEIFTGIVGAFWGLFVGFGMSTGTVAKYKDPVQNENAMISIRCHSSKEWRKALNFLRNTGAQDILASDRLKDFWKLTSKPRVELPKVIFSY
jgi:hypothetical protein